MSRRVVVEPEAEAELQAAAEWYERQRPGLGFLLLANSEAALALVSAGAHGTSIPGTETEARRVPVPRFPLWIVFIEHEETVVVVAYAHERRRPGYWLDRVRSS